MQQDSVDVKDTKSEWQPIQNTDCDAERNQNEPRVQKPAKNRSAKGDAANMRKIKTKDVNKPNAKDDGDNETQKKLGTHSENGSKKTERNISQTSGLVETKETQPVDYENSLTLTKAETLSSMNLLKASANHLHNLMKGLQSETERQRINDQVATVDQQKAKTATHLAQGIVNIAKVQLEAIKLMHKIQRDK